MSEVLRQGAGDIGWIGLATYVIAFDALASETLSTAFDRYLDTTAGKVIAGVVGGAVVGHLFNVIPQRLDPLHQGFDLLRRVTGR